MRKEHISLLIIAVIYIGALWLWALPIGRMPFGDVDSAGHFILGDYMAQKDKSLYKLPFFIVPMYGYANNNKLWYPPQYHTNEAIFQVFGGERIVPVYLWVLIASTLVILSTFFVVNKLYGLLPAMMASFLLMFSARDYLTYLWAQWPQTAAFAFVAIVVYCYYKYTESYLANAEKRIYLYLTAAFTAIQYFFHPQATSQSALALIVYSAILIARHKKMPFGTKTALKAVALFVIVMLPFFHFSIKSITSFSETPDNYIAPITRLLAWYPSYERYKGLIPESYFSYSLMHGLWTLPFLLIGLLFLILRRQNRDILMLSWLVSYYLIIHMDVLGKLTGRLHRSMFAEAHIFYPIIALGALAIPSFFKMAGSQKAYLKYGIAVLFIVLAINFNAGQAYSQLNTAYAGVGRLNEAQYDAASWIRQNLPQDSGLRIAGTLVPAKKKWIGFLAYKVPVYDYKLFGDESAELNLTNYILVDYTDAIMLGRKDVFEAINQWEIENLKNKSQIYNKDYIRVYEVG